MSHHLAVDFVEKKPFSPGNINGFSLVFMLFGLIASLYVYQQFQTAKVDKIAAQEALNAVQPQSKKIKPKKQVAQLVLTKAELKQASETAAMLDIQWQSLFSGLEQLKMRHVALLSIEPNVKKQRLVLTGQGKSMRSILDYVAQVEALPMLSRVYLQKHQVDEESPYKPVNFTIVARWL